MIAFDTNLLVYAHRRESRNHETAAAVVRALAEGDTTWAIPWPCCSEFLGVVTSPRIWKDEATAGTRMAPARRLDYIAVESTDRRDGRLSGDTGPFRRAAARNRSGGPRRPSRRDLRLTRRRNAADSGPRLLAVSRAADTGPDRVAVAAPSRAVNAGAGAILESGVDAARRWVDGTARARSSTDRASVFGTEGWGFESLRARHRTYPIRLTQHTMCV